MRSAIPPTAPSAFAAQRHRDGMSCVHLAAYKYDANGYRRWCIDCDAPLGEEASWHPEGHNISARFLAACLIAVAIVVACLVLLLTSTTIDVPPAPGPVPSTIGPPPVGS